MFFERFVHCVGCNLKIVWRWFAVTFAYFEKETVDEASNQTTSDRSDPVDLYGKLKMGLKINKKNLFKLYVPSDRPISPWQRPVQTNELGSCWLPWTWSIKIIINDIYNCIIWWLHLWRLSQIPYNLPPSDVQQ